MSKEEQILEALGGVKNSFILESSKYVGNPEIGTLQKPQGKHSWKQLLSTAAMLALVVTGLIALFSGLNPPEADKTSRNVDTSLSYYLTVSNNKSVKIVLETPATEEAYRKINRVLVYDDRENLIQTITPEDTVSDGIFLNEGLFINVGRTVGEPDCRDVNFDGCGDFGLLACSTYPRNVPYNYFLWNEALGKFEFGFTIFGSSALVIDNDEQCLVMVDNTPSPAVQYRYRYENGKLILLSEQEQEVLSNPLDDISIFYSQKDYLVTYENNMAYIRSRYADSTSGEKCELEVRFVDGLYPYAAALLARETLERTGKYTNITEGVDNRGTITLSATGGTDWNSPCADVRFFGVGAAGTYQLTARYFLEAAEGHGANFQIMMDGVICDPQSPNAEAEKVITSFANAYFAGDWAKVQNYLTKVPDRWDVYTENGELVQYISMSGLDALAERDDAVVSLTFLETPDSDSYTYLTMDVTKVDGEYKILFYGLEK